MTNSSKKAWWENEEKHVSEEIIYEVIWKRWISLFSNFRTVYKLEHGGVNKKIKQKYLLKRPKSTEERIFFVWVKILKQCEAFYRELMKKIARTSIAQSLDIFVVRLKGGSVSFTQFTKFNALWWVEYLTKRENHKYICAEYQQNNMSSKTQNKKSKNIKQLEVIDLREKNSC